MSGAELIYGDEDPPDIYGDGGLDDIYGDGEQADDMYGDPDLAPAKYKPELPPEVVVTMDSLYVTDEIAIQPWFAGRIDRAEAEKRIKDGTRAGNFLIREKGKHGTTFVHSYLSLTRMTIIHNVIEFAPDGTCKVDGQPWVHHKKPRLAEVVDMMQQIRRARKGVRAAAEVDKAVVERVTKLWPQISPLGLDRSEANKSVMQMGVGGLAVTGTPNPKLYLLVVKTSTGCYEASIVKSAQGFYLRFSELVAPTLQDLIAQIVVNERAAFMSGLPQALDLHQLHGAAPPPVPDARAHRAPPPPPVDDSLYGDLPGGETYDDVEPPDAGASEPDVYGNDAYDDTGSAAGAGGIPPPRPPKKPPAPPVDEDVIYGD